MKKKIGIKKLSKTKSILDMSESEFADLMKEKHRSLILGGRAFLADIAGFVCTGQPSDWHLRAEDLDMGRAKSPAMRWEIPHHAEFDEDCRIYETGAQDSGEQEGEGEIEAVSYLLGSLVRRLVQEARLGSPRAIRSLATMARDSATALESLTGEDRRLICSVAEASDAFPVLISKNTDQSGPKYVQEKLRELNIGARGHINPTGYDMRASGEQPYKAALHQMVVRLHAVIEKERGSDWYRNWDGLPPWLHKTDTLPDLSESPIRGAAKAWFEVGWELLVWATGGHPERLPQFISSGKSAGDYKRGTVKESSGRQRKFANGDQRGLHDRLRSAYMARFDRTPRGHATNPDLPKLDTEQ